MRMLTIKGFLEQYLRSLSEEDTTNIFKLSKEAELNPRLREPLFLYALSAEKIDILLRATSNSDLYAQYKQLSEIYDMASILYALETENNSLDDRYHKVYRSYICKRDMYKTNSRTKQLMHSKIKRIQSSKGVTAYRISTDLKLNRSNVSSFIKSGDNRKVSLNTARKILKYLEEA